MATLTPIPADTETRQRLLTAAAELFAERGFNKVSIRDICQKADANVAAVNYHFRDKLGLYKEVVQMLGECMDRAKGSALDAGAGSAPEEQLRLYIRTFMHHLLGPEEDSWMDRLMARELMDPTPALDLIIEKGIRPTNERLGRLVAQILGVPPNDERVWQCAVSVQAQCVFYKMGKPIAIRMNPPGFKFTPEIIDGLAEHVYRFSLAGMRAAAA